MEFMREAIRLAKLGTGRVSPNPLVGAVIVRDGEIIGRGYHRRYGDLHAERDALKNLAKNRKSAEGADMYVTLEPCCHYGKQPPCTDAIIKSGIKRVFIGSADPNPLVAGKGANMLRKNGIEVIENVLKNECDNINYIFFYYIKTGKPYVALKYSMSLDGKIAAHTGESQWITGDAARSDVHKKRNHYSAIMVGLGTVISDDPQLTCRISGGRNPIRIICDTNLRTPLDCNLVKTATEIRTIILSTVSDIGKISPYTDLGCEVLTVPLKNGHIDLSAAIKLLGNMKIDSIMIEGGGTLAWSAIKSKTVNKVLAYVAPCIIGGAGAKSPVDGTGFSHMNEILRLKKSSVVKIGDDFLIESEVERCLPE